MRKTLVFIVLCAFALGAGSSASAQTADASCDFSAQIKELRSVQANMSLNILQEMRAEIAIRRALLPAVIACDEQEIVALTAALDSLPGEFKSMPAYGKTLEGFASALRYYEERRSGIPTMGLQGLKNTARAVAEWRSETYLPLVELADNFILWAGNQEFLDRASGRLAQVKNLALPLKLVSHDDINERFEEARVRIESAFVENDKARDALNKGLAADGLAHIQASLQAIADTYQIFFKIQEDLQNIIK